MLTAYDYQTAQILDEAGVPVIFVGDTLGIFFAGRVLEAVPNEAARRVTEALLIATIGIGAGPHCDAQVLISTEILGLSAGPRPRFAKLYAALRAEIARAAATVVEDVRAGAYPGPEQCCDWEIKPA